MPTAAEEKTIERAKFLFANRSVKAIALIDGHDVIYSGFKSPVTADSYLYGLSLAKTITSMAVGKALCAGLLQMSSKAEDLVPELKGTALGAATVQDLLTMSSGAKDGGESILSVKQRKLWGQGELNQMDLLLEDRVSGAREGLFHRDVPGQDFRYKNADPIVLGLMLGRAANSTYAKWTFDNVLVPAGIASPAIIAQDRMGHAAANGGFHMKMEDWIRIAIWAKDSSRETGCFGDYMRQAIHTQIKNADKNSGPLFDGYGYLVWTDTRYAPDSYWAAGHGGQKIGWSYRNDRIVVAFSNSADWLKELYGLFDDWSHVKE
jgi:CubicO group peptidase (beta-lactamase class C family)